MRLKGGPRRCGPGGRTSNVPADTSARLVYFSAMDTLWLQLLGIVRHLALDVVEEAMIRHGARVTDAAGELGVPISDLRKLCFAVPRLMDVAFEHEEKRIDLAEQRIDEALRSDDSRRHDAAAMFVLRNSSKAKRRGWITAASASVDMNIQTNRTVNYTFRWRTPEDDARNAEAAEIERLREEGEQVVSIGWGNPDHGNETIERDGKSISVPR